MSEEFDDDLSKHIAHVFDQYEDTAPAEEGWLLLRQKFPPKKKRRILPLWWSVAAALLIAALFGLWFYNQPQQSKAFIAKTKIKTQPADTLIQNNPHSTTKQLQPAAKNQSADEALYAATDGKKVNQKHSNASKHNSAYSPELTAANTFDEIGNIKNQPMLASSRARSSGTPNIVSGSNQPEAMRGASEKTGITSVNTNNAIVRNTDSAQNVGVSLMAEQRVQQHPEKSTTLYGD